MSEVTFTTQPTGAAAPEPQADPNRPAWLPENIKTPEELATSYAALQAKFTQTSQELATFKKPAAPGEAENNSSAPAENTSINENKPKTDAEQSDAAKVAEAAGFDLNPYSDEYATTGDVAEENRAKIAEGLKGVLGEGARSVVDQYIEGQKAVQANDLKLQLDAAGGEEHWTAMSKWAGEALPKEEVALINRQLDSGDRTAALFAIQGLRAKYEAVNGRDPKILLGGGGGIPSAAGFKSSAEMTAAMRDPRYKTDPAYRNEVGARLAVSTF